MGSNSLMARMARIAGMLALLSISLSCSNDNAERNNALPSPASLPAVPPAQNGAFFPLRIEPGKPHLVDASGRPFLLVGDSAWSLLLQLSRAEIDAYLEDRRQRGYNTVLINVLESHFAITPPRNRERAAPFLRPKNFGSAAEFVSGADFSRPNPQYFDLLDFLLVRASEKNMLVMAVPAYPGYLGGEQGWWVAMEKNGRAKMRAYGRFLGHRYRSHRNILWVQGGDFNVPDKALVREIANGIREYDTERLHTFHGARGTGAHDWMSGEPWLTLGNIYTDEVVYPAAEKHMAQHPGLPFILIEAYYEGAKPDPRLTRWQAYQALLCGASGQISGHDVIWQFKTGWQDALDSSTSQAMFRLATLFRSVDWWKLKPDVDHRLLTGGLSTGVERAVAATAADGSFAITYTPSLRDLIVNLKILSGPRVDASWMDPLTGDFLRVTGAPFERSTQHIFRPPGLNAAGSSDWVLVLKSSA